MKKLITLLTLLFVLTSCFGKDSEEWVTIDTNSGNTQVDWDTIVVNPEDNNPTTPTEIEEVNVNINESGSNTTEVTEVITVSWSLDEQEVLDDIDSLLNDIITSAENE
jgi:hypothetical protein